MTTKLGFGGLNKNVNSSTDSGRGKQKEDKPIIFNGRVIEVFLDKNDPNLVGCIQYVSTKNTPADISTVTNNQFSIARPLFPNITKVPLINEIVTLIHQPGKNLKAKSTDDIVYYITGVKVYNHPHHNSIPFKEGNLQPTQQKTIDQTILGSPLVNTPQSTEIFLGNTFKERDTINPLLPFEGDVIYEGRWGNSIRFGSTNKTNNTNTPLNNWSSGSSNSGDPILILSNGQGPTPSNGYEYITEDINTDFGSIYFGSTQQIPLNASSTSSLSYTSNPPTIPNQYSGKQIIINSGRLVFNSFEDHILFSSKKSVNLNAVESINIDAPTTIIQSTNTYIGSKNANEPLLLGNLTVELLDKFFTNLSGFMTICSTVASVPIPQLNTAAAQLNVSLKALQANLETLKSKYNYTV
jgi:hypothetical protein